jgi:hypothetical protein
MWGSAQTEALLALSMPAVGDGGGEHRVMPGVSSLGKWAGGAGATLTEH